MKKLIALLLLPVCLAGCNTSTRQNNISNDNTQNYTMIDLINQMGRGKYKLKSIRNQSNKQKLNKIEFKTIKKEDNNRKSIKVSRSEDRNKDENTYKDLGNFTLTAYTLGYESCGKSVNDKAYGITASGFDLKGLSRIEAMTVSVDKRIIPLGSKVYITFKDDKYKKYEGIYHARDTGGAIKGNKIDLFIPDLNEAIEFGRVKANVKLIQEQVKNK